MLWPPKFSHSVSEGKWFKLNSSALFYIHHNFTNQKSALIYSKEVFYIYLDFPGHEIQGTPSGIPLIAHSLASEPICYLASCTTGGENFHTKNINFHAISRASNNPRPQLSITPYLFASAMLWRKTRTGNSQSLVRFVFRLIQFSEHSWGKTSRTIQRRHKSNLFSSIDVYNR